MAKKYRYIILDIKNKATEKDWDAFWEVAKAFDTWLRMKNYGWYDGDEWGFGCDDPDFVCHSEFWFVRSDVFTQAKQHLRELAMHYGLRNYGIRKGKGQIESDRLGQTANKKLQPANLAISFIRKFYELLDRKVQRSQIFDLYQQIEQAVRGKQITAKDKYAAELEQISAILAKLYNSGQKTVNFSVPKDYKQHLEKIIFKTLQGLGKTNKNQPPKTSNYEQHANN